MKRTLMSVGEYQRAIKAGDMEKTIEFWRFWPILLCEDFDGLKYQVAEVYRLSVSALSEEMESKGLDVRSFHLTKQAFDRVVFGHLERDFRLNRHWGYPRESWPERLGLLADRFSPVLQDSLSLATFALEEVFNAGDFLHVFNLENELKR